MGRWRDMGVVFMASLRTLGCPSKKWNVKFACAATANAFLFQKWADTGYAPSFFFSPLCFSFLSRRALIAKHANFFGRCFLSGEQKTLN